MEEIENTLTSMEVAEMVSKNHADVMRDIRRIIEQIGQSKNAESYFIADTYLNTQNKEQPCYRLTKKGCELFSTRMTGAKGTQFAVAYIERFNQMENHIKQELDFSGLSPELQMFNQILLNAANQEKRILAVEEKQNTLTDILSLNSTNWRDDMGKIIRKIAYRFGGGTSYQELQQSIYDEVERRGGFKFNVRLRNMQTRQIEKGYSKSATKKLNKLDVIEADKKAIEIYVAVVKEFAAHYEVSE